MANRNLPNSDNDTRAGASSGAAARFSAFRDSVRRLKGRIDCALIRTGLRVQRFFVRRHRASLHRMRAGRLFHPLGELLYSLGFEGEYALIRFGRGCIRARHVLAWLARRFGAGARRVFGLIGRTLWEDLCRPVVVFFAGIFHLLRHARKVRREKGFWRALWEALCYLGRGIRRYANLVPRTIAYIVPAVVLFFCASYVRGQLATHYSLAVQVDDRTVGYVQSESVFDAAKSAVDERINYAGTEGVKWSITPTYTLSTVQSTMDENQMADAILQASSDQITEGTALYIDGQLCRITEDGTSLAAYLDGLQAPYRTADSSSSVRFNHDVQLVHGIFFTSSFSSYDDVIAYLSSDQMLEQDYTVVKGDSISLIASKNGLTFDELAALNPGLALDSKLYPGDKLIVQKQESVLEVQIVQQVTETVEIPYTTVTTESDDYAWGTTKTVQEGVSGSKSVTTEYVKDTDGNVISAEVLNETILSEPVTKQIVKGTKTPTGTVAKVGNGSLMWPVPGYRYCSRWATLPGGHKGVDICAAAGTPILAADSGVVIKAGYSAAGSGYGNSIVIDHGNGYQTLYGHCLALYVSVGQSVSQGQVIGAVGSTGRSTGNHCHFEIFHNGTRIAPQTIFGGY